MRNYVLFTHENLRLARLPLLSYDVAMKTLTVRLPDSLATEIEHESQVRRVSKSDVVRERLHQPPPAAGGAADAGFDSATSSAGWKSCPVRPCHATKRNTSPILIRAKKLHRR